MEPIVNLDDLFVVFDINPRDSDREDRLRRRLFNYSNTGITILADNVSVRLVGWGREDGEALIEGDTSISFHSSLAYPFEKNDLLEAVDEMEDRIWGVGFAL